MKILNLIQQCYLELKITLKFELRSIFIIHFSACLLNVLVLLKSSFKRNTFKLITTKHSLLFLSLLSNVGFSQNSAINFAFHFGNSPLVLDKKYAFKNDSISITKFRFYISDIEFLNNETITYRLKKKHHLIDISNKTSIQIEATNHFKFNQIHFNIGIDSITNVSGAMGEDLDPTKGMYWAWQSGYINLKLEGKCNTCKTRNNEFQLHIGGYQSPFNTLQKLKINVKENKPLTMMVDLKAFLQEFTLENNCTIMSPSAQSVNLTHHFKKLISMNEEK